MKSQKTYSSIYRGIVIQNNDPAGIGRVKVFIPALHSNLILQQKDYENENLTFGDFGENINSDTGSMDITQYIDTLRQKITQWSYVLQPITGETGQTKFNSSNRKTTDSDSDDFDASFDENREGNADGPGAILDGFEDVWSSTSNSGGAQANPTGGAYNYNKRYNQAKGSFGTIAVNTKVWVVFVNGNPMEPVVIGADPAAGGAQEIFTPDMSPGEYENSSTAGDSPESKIFRGGSVENTGAMTRISKSTTGEAIYSETHKSGSSKTILNDGTVASLAAANQQDAVLGDKFQDVRGSRNTHVAGQQTSVVKGDHIVRIGSGNVAAAQAEKAVLEGIHDSKSLFEIQRTEGGSIYSSTKQKKSGAPKPCPECSQGKTYQAVNINIEEEINKIPNTVISWAEGFIKGLLDKIVGALEALPPIVIAGRNIQPFQQIPEPNIELPKNIVKLPGLKSITWPPPSECKVCRGKGESPFSYDGDWDPEPEKEKIKQMYEDAGGQLAAIDEALGDGGNHMVEVTRNMVINVGGALNTMSDVRVDKKGKKVATGITVGKQRTYQTQGESPLFEKVHVDNLKGGQFTCIAGNGANFVVGSRGLNFDCFGSVKVNGSCVKIGGSQVIIASKNEVSISSECRLALEGKALSMKSGTGQVMMENNMGVSGNMIVGGGAHIEGELCVNHVTAPIEFQLTEPAPILQGQINGEVTKKIGFLPGGTDLKLVIKSGAGAVKVGGVPGNLEPGIEVTFTFPEDIPIWSKGNSSTPDEKSIFIYPHDHVFRNLPLTLVGSNEGVREAGAQMNDMKPVPPGKIANGRKGPESMKTPVVNADSLNSKSFKGDQKLEVKSMTFEKQPDADSGDETHERQEPIEWSSVA
jgi:hypothetical protein